MKRHLLSLLLFCCFSLFVPASVVAEGISFGIAQYYPVKADKIEDGNIVSVSEDGYTLSGKQYDLTMVGVISQNPAISLKRTGDTGNEYPVINSGKAYVLVNGLNGPITEGDLITSSGVAGVGMRSSRPGFVIGTALEDYAPASPNDQKRIMVSLSLHFSMLNFEKMSERGSLFAERMAEIYDMSFLAAYEQPSAVFRYVVAGLVVLMSIMFSFLTFARIAKNGIEAFGRNPLAAKLIGIGMVLNVVIAVAIVSSGLGVAYLILAL